MRRAAHFAPQPLTTLVLLALAPLGCADLGCPEGTVLDRQQEMCVRTPSDLGVHDMGTHHGDMGPDTGMALDQGPCPPCGEATPLCNVATMECVECLGMGDCGGDRPQCDAATGTCVVCLNSTHCGGATPVCSSGACVGCEDAGDCNPTDPVCQTPGLTCGDCTTRAHCLPYAAQPSCNVVSGTCVACDIPNETADCADTPSTPVCNANRQCVQCRTNTHCLSATASRCTGDTCASCMNDSHCSHLSGTPRCFGGTCRECTPATEAVDCGGNSCDPATRVCSGNAIGSQGVCESCVSDSDCSQTGGTFRCIPMNYMGVARGGYCLRSTPGCARPFLSLITGPSLSGAASTTYCSIDQNVVSCEAVNALRASATCPSGNASECMADGALCNMVGAFSNRCTYVCSVPDECLASGAAASCGAGHCGS